ncbi:hypothetical protein DL766_001107 [Monosporascus sp. MC13-8B]|uniref:DUF1754-domain-containing protein n=1 Tax=Monosporascus cannonballus TaxID=155416 RepID=A0ABY0H7E9_9PEZI|nr:hypothetical protein DL762_004536 [Monosporascus cannonballus]RYO90529.1 hypothetical protein DL763_005294 [Monosporascus cannonballus]RYP38197.1 hypothetical protein DL766_001107 [Monosporascus sp. MC13-8B]
MGADDYAVAGGGALKLKGAKVQKSKKKKKDKSSNNLERSLSVIEGDDDPKATSSSSSKEAEKKEKKKRREDSDDGAGDTEKSDHDTVEYKTEAERRHEEIQRRKLLKMFEDGSAKPELLKTHKERVEGLNTYLSKLSEHHDMPKIGPG